ncbi:MAG: hypothetical protein N3D85_03365 [Candidatus Bathyarchaeota archaeon]|nr:hypothetical protein [Candidatus Bathyarchaeota archaeon]
MLNLKACPFNLDVTLCCGQVFRWNKIGDWWFGVAKDKVFKIRQVEKRLEFVNVNSEFVCHYFGLNDDLQKIKESINKDAHICRALEKLWGLRLIQQDPWECLASYICATYKGIPAIKTMLNKLAQKFGEKTVFEGYDFYNFPTVDALACATLDSLSACGLGYRAKYLKTTAKKIFEQQFDLEELRQLPYAEAKKILCNFTGVGPKVADCVLLFSLGKYEAFPVDVWIKRVVLRHYNRLLPRELTQKLAKSRKLDNSKYSKISEICRNYFGDYAGYAQEYLYHYERMTNIDN